VLAALTVGVGVGVFDGVIDGDAAGLLGEGVTDIDMLLDGVRLGVGVGEPAGLLLVGVIEGVIDIEIDLDGVIDGVIDIDMLLDGVIDGVIEGVTDIEILNDGVIVGVDVGVGVETADDVDGVGVGVGVLGQTIVLLKATLRTSYVPNLISEGYKPLPKTKSAIVKILYKVYCFL
jgi:hypothetical protein